jgi:Ca2+-binding EF-hand superfamily protein
MITDEAKLIFEAMDGNHNGQLTRTEFMASKRIKDPKLAAAIFKALDTNGNGELVIPEYLRVWGKWARH